MEITIKLMENCYSKKHNLNLHLLSVRAKRRAHYNCNNRVETF